MDLVGEAGVLLAGFIADLNAEGEAIVREPRSGSRTVASFEFDKTAEGLQRLIGVIEESGHSRILIINN